MEYERTKKVLEDMGKQINDILARNGYITETKMCEILGLCPPPYSGYYGMVLVDKNDILRMEV